MATVVSIGRSIYGDQSRFEQVRRAFFSFDRGMLCTSHRCICD